MYTSQIPIAEGATSAAANGSINVTSVGYSGPDKAVMLVITTPWGSTAIDSMLIEGQISQTFDYTTWGERVYIVKLLSVDEIGRIATFQALSFVYDGRVLSSGGVNQLNATDNIPTRAAPGILNYDYTITNNSSGQILLRYIFATSTSSAITIKRSGALPPTTYGDKLCWYDDWAAGTLACQDKTIGPGLHYDITGSLTIPSSGEIYELLGIFVYMPNYWPGGKGEYVAPAGFQSGRLKSTIADPCIGKICTPDYMCQGCDSYQTICNPANPTGPCIQGPLIQLNDSRCTTNGYINISSTPSGATIYVDNLPMGITGTTPVIVEASVLANPHTVRLVLTNYVIWVDNNVNVSCTTPVIINPTLTPWTPKIAQIIVELDPLTPGTYVSNPNVINRFTDILNNQVLMRFANITLNSVTYDSPNHQIIIEIEELQTLSSYQYSLLSYNIKTLGIWVPIVLAIVIILAALPLVQMLLGWIWKRIYSWIKGVPQTTANVKVTTCIAISESTCVIPTDPVIVEFAGQKLTADTSNSFMVTFNNIKVQGAETTYPIKAYIPVSSGSNVYKASYEGTVNPTIPVTDLTIRLKPEQATERDYTPPCPLRYPDGTQVLTGTIIKIFQPIIGPTGTATIREYGNRTVRADGCIDPVKVKSYLTNDMLQWQAIPQDISPTSPDPTPQNGNSGIIKRVMDTKNKITVLTYSTGNNDLTVDKIDIKNLDTNTIVKTKSGADIKSSQTEIEGIPIGRYQAIITKSGYNISSCTLGCAVEFTTDYLQAITFTALLESIVPTCATLEVYVLDKYSNEIKTIPYVSMDDKPEQPVSGKKLEIKEVTASNHKFSVRADKYTSVTENKVVSCTDTVATVIFKLDPIGDVIPASMELTVKDQKGSVSVDKSTPFTVKVTGANPGEDVGFYNIDTTPDTLLAHDLADTTGFYQTDITINEDTTFQLQSLQGCILGICGKDSNIVEIKVGKGSPECAIPNPLGGCLVYKETLKAVGMGLLVALLGVAALGMVILRTPAGGERMVYYPPSTPGAQPTIIKEKPPTVAGKLIEKVGT